MSIFKDYTDEDGFVYNLLDFDAPQENIFAHCVAKVLWHEEALMTHYIQDLQIKKKSQNQRLPFQGDDIRKINILKSNF